MKYFWKWLKKLIICIGIVIVVFTLVFNIRIYYGNNMFPSIRDGDLVITYRWQSPNSDDLILYKQGNKYKLGRVLAIANEKVEITQDNRVYVNDNDETSNTFYETVSDKVEYPYTVPDNSYFVINDYRSDKSDSRKYGAIRKNNIKGVVIFLIRRRGF